MEPQNVSKPEASTMPIWMQWESSSWYIDIKKDTHKPWANKIKSLIRAGINLSSVAGIESDIDELVAKPDCTNIDETMINSQTNSNALQLYPEAIKILEERSNGVHLSYFEKKEIIKLLDKGIMTKRQMWIEFSLSKCAINKAVRQYCLNKSPFSSSRRLPCKLKKSEVIIDIILKFINDRENPYTSRDVQIEIKNILGIFVPLHIVRDQLK